MKNQLSAIIIFILIFVGCGGENQQAEQKRFPQIYPKDFPKKIVAKKDKVEMILIPAGEFLMGSTKEEVRDTEEKWGLKEGLLEPETPQHIVYVDAFYIDKYEITNAQYQKFVVETGHRVPAVPTKEEVTAAIKSELKELGRGEEEISPAQINATVQEHIRNLNAWAWKNRTYPPGKANHPVVLVNWYDAQAYAKWAGKRLPTEAEWEKAARGVEARFYPWGNDWDLTRCNSAERIALRPLLTLQESLQWFYDEWRNLEPAERAKNTTVSVGSYPKGKSPYGIHDMAGNVFEWCADWYDKDYYSYSPKRNPQGAKNGTTRVLRGGSWNYPGFKLRSTYRNKHAPQIGGSPNGFRCVMDVNKVSQ
jgi:formylglycine-generating enzyme required for sulfatase activity